MVGADSDWPFWLSFKSSESDVSDLSSRLAEVSSGGCIDDSEVVLML